MVGKTNVGSGKLFAVIAVTYPEGSICTCSDGTKTMKAKDTSGKALFNVKAGTYTVECHTSDNSKSKSISVTVTESDAGKAIAVTLGYELILYDNGTFNKDATGDWIDTVTYGENSGGITENSSYMSFAGGYHTYRVFSHKTPIDITSYDSLNVTFQVTGSSGYKCDFGVGTSNNDEIFSASVTGLASGNKITKNLSISEVNGNNYFKFLVRSEMTVKFYKAWLT